MKKAAAADANRKHGCGSQAFWRRGCHVDAAGKNERMIQDHIRNPLEDDGTSGRVSLKELCDPFTSEK